MKKFFHLLILIFFLIIINGCTSQTEDFVDVPIPSKLDKSSNSNNNFFLASKIIKNNGNIFKVNIPIDLIVKNKEIIGIKEIESLEIIPKNPTKINIDKSTINYTVSLDKNLPSKYASISLYFTYEDKMSKAKHSVNTLVSQEIPK